MGAGERIGHGRQHERYGPDRQQQQRQACDIRFPFQADCHDKGRKHVVGNVTCEREQCGFERQRRPDVSVDLVRDLVREHRLDFIVGMRGEQRVRDQDATRATDTDKCGVRLRRTISEAPLIGAQYWRPRALCQREQSFAQFVTRERSDVVEQRKKQHRRESRKQDERGGEKDRRKDPPVFWALPHEPRDDHASHYQRDQNNRCRLDMIGQPSRHGFRRESIAPLENHPPIEGEGQMQQLR